MKIELTGEYTHTHTHNANNTYRVAIITLLEVGGIQHACFPENRGLNCSVVNVSTACQLILLFLCGYAHSTQVTGAGQNLGRELAVQLSRLGAKLILLDINEVGEKSSLLPLLLPLKISPIIFLSPVLLYLPK